MRHAAVPFALIGERDPQRRHGPPSERLRRVEGVAARERAHAPRWCRSRGSRTVRNDHHVRPHSLDGREQARPIVTVSSSPPKAWPLVMKVSRRPAARRLGTRFESRPGRAAPSDMTYAIVRAPAAAPPRRSVPPSSAMVRRRPVRRPDPPSPLAPLDRSPRRSVRPSAAGCSGPSSPFPRVRGRRMPGPGSHD